MRDSRRTRIVLAVLLVVSLTLVALDLRDDDGGPLSGIGRFGAAVLGPLEGAFTTVTSPVRGAVDSLTSGSEKDARIAELEAEIERLRDSGAGEEAAKRIAELDALLRLAGAGQYRIVPARVIAVGPAQDFAWTVTIDGGAPSRRRSGRSAPSGAARPWRARRPGP